MVINIIILYPIVQCVPHMMLVYSVVVGTLPTLLHLVGGTLVFLSTTRIRIVGFSFDGGAPGMMH